MADGVSLPLVCRNYFDTGRKRHLVAKLHSCMGEAWRVVGPSGLVGAAALVCAVGRHRHLGVEVRAPSCSPGPVDRPIRLGRSGDFDAQ